MSSRSKMEDRYIKGEHLFEICIDNKVKSRHKVFFFGIIQSVGLA